MTYRIARNGELFGPYSLIEVQRYLASGQIVPSDLGQAEGAQEWLPISELFPVPAPHHAPRPGGLPVLFADPPDLPWWVALILGVFTMLAFFVVWDIVEAAWLRRIKGPGTALVLYIAFAMLYVFKLPIAWHTTLHNLGLAPPVEAPHATLITIASIVLLMASRFVFRAELLRHFNGPEPIGLRLNVVLTFLFGGLYFQYHFNRINQMKRALRVSVPAV